MDFGYLILIIVILTVSSLGVCFNYEKNLRIHYFKETEEERNFHDTKEQLGRNEVNEKVKKRDKEERKRGKAYPVDDVWTMFCGFFGGSLGLLIGYLIFPMIRREDSFQHYRFLIVTIVTNIIYVTAVVLLCVFKVIKF